MCDYTAMATVGRGYVAMLLLLLTFWQTHQLGKSPQTHDFYASASVRSVSTISQNPMAEISPNVG